MVTKVSVNNEEAVEIQDAGAREILAQRKVLKYVCIYGAVTGSDWTSTVSIVVPMMLGVDEEISSLAQLRAKIENWTYGNYEYAIPATGIYYASNSTPFQKPITGIYYGSDNGIGVIIVWDGNPVPLVPIHDQDVKQVITQEL